MVLYKCLVIVQDDCESGEFFGERISKALAELSVEHVIYMPIQATCSANGRNTVFISHSNIMPDPPPPAIGFDPSGTGTPLPETLIVSSSAKQNSTPSALGGDGD